MKTFISHLLQISHSQWIFWNYTLHDKQRGYLRLRLRTEVLREIHELLETPPSEVPPECQYLLELDHSAVYTASYEEQIYWILALKAAQRAGRRAATSQRARGRSQHTRLACNRETRIRYDFRVLEDQMGYELRRQNTPYFCFGQHGLKQKATETGLTAGWPGPIRRYVEVASSTFSR